MGYTDFQKAMATEYRRLAEESRRYSAEGNYREWKNFHKLLFELEDMYYRWFFGDISKFFEIYGEEECQ